ncbi:hypothetical protein C3E99_08295 [Sphingopyxis sp. MG]|nr:hypothetical protein C3E99_08295 [Sphingopyxis sp. MG]
MERHLGLEADDDLFAKAMVSICDGFPPDCSYAHTCLHDGDCFKSGNPALRAARVIEAMASRAEGSERVHILAAARWLRQDGASIGSAEVLPFTTTKGTDNGG